MSSCLNTTSSTLHVREKDLIHRGLYAPEVFMDELFSTIDLVAIIGKYVALKPKAKTGAYANEFVGLCPFHREKTPSFTVSPDKGFFHCFGCGAHGNAPYFLQRISQYRLSYPRAIAKLARSVGMPVKYYDWYKKDYFAELKRWERKLHKAQNDDWRLGNPDFWADQKEWRKEEMEAAIKMIEYYRTAVAAIMETKDRRYSNFHGKNYQEIVGEPIYPISDELLDILERDRADREANNW